MRSLLVIAACISFLLLSSPVFGQSKPEDPPLNVLKVLADLSPEDATIRHKIGVAYFRMKRYREAASAFRQEIRLNPESAGGYKALGITYAILGRKQEALDALLESIRVCPNASLELTPEQYNALSRNDPRLASKLFKGTYK